MGQQVSSQVVIDIPCQQAWKKLQDISLAHNYVPGIKRTEIVSENVTGIGASRYVYRGAKSYIQETVEEWNEGEGFLIRLHKGDKPAPPFKAAWFRYRLESDGPQRTRFTASLKYQMPWGAVGEWLGGRLEGIVQGTLDDVAAAMKLYYETGQPTTAATLKAYKRSIR